MTKKLTIALAQLNPVVGDIAGNADKLRAARKLAHKSGVDIIVTTELFITGYPPEDLVKKPAFHRAAQETVEDIALETDDGGPAILLGTPWLENDHLYNSVAVLDEGRVQDVIHKFDLPNYGVFDEKRLFEVGPEPEPTIVRGVKTGIPICEDIWQPDVCALLKTAGAQLLISPNGSPFWDGKQDTRLTVAASRVREVGLPMIYVNQFGGQDELVFDGGSFILNADCDLALQMPTWQEGVSLSHWQEEDGKWSCVKGEIADVETELEAIYQACVLGTRDYVNKNHFPGVVLGMSGGIDSALCAAIAVDALGPDRVKCVMMPYTYTSQDSLKDAKDCANALGAHYDILPIYEPVDGFMSSLKEMFAGTKEDTTEENIQSRTRGTLLMALSNKFGDMVLTTGNKSEVSVGYATLYGDMNGGYNPIKDVFKMEVFALSRLRNEIVPKGCLGPEGEVIPDNIITKPPSAELKEGQTDQDSLPPYDVLDDILEALVEHELSVNEVAERGHSPELVEKILHMLHIAEYKRRQAAPGVKISQRNFGRDRRYPITNAFRDTAE